MNNNITIQKDRSRYTFIQTTFESGRPRYTIIRECLFHIGGSMSFEETTKDRGNELYKKLINEGFKQFRNAREVSWYATEENNTPYEEEWAVEGKYLVPVKSRVLFT